MKINRTNRSVYVIHNYDSLMDNKNSRALVRDTVFTTLANYILTCISGITLMIAVLIITEFERQKCVFKVILLFGV